MRYAKDIFMAIALVLLVPVLLILFTVAMFILICRRLFWDMGRRYGHRRARRMRTRRLNAVLHLASTTPFRGQMRRILNVGRSSQLSAEPLPGLHQKALCTLTAARSGTPRAAMRSRNGPAPVRDRRCDMTKSLGWSATIALLLGTS